MVFTLGTDGKIVAICQLQEIDDPLTASPQLEWQPLQQAIVTANQLPTPPYPWDNVHAAGKYPYLSLFANENNFRGLFYVLGTPVDFVVAPGTSQLVWNKIDIANGSEIGKAELKYGSTVVLTEGHFLVVAMQPKALQTAPKFKGTAKLYFWATSRIFFCDEQERFDEKGQQRTGWGHTPSKADTDAAPLKGIRVTSATMS